MRRYAILLLLAVTWLWIGSPLPAVAADDAAKIFQDVCLDCHKSPKKRKQIEDAHLSRQEWKEAFDRMIDQGAELPQDKIPEMIEFMLKDHGPLETAPDAGKSADSATK